jgi:type IV pilus assembly protein PilW
MKIQLKKLNRYSMMNMQNGLTIVELLISITLGLAVMLAGTTLLLASKSSYVMVDDAAQIQDTGRFALDVIARTVRQTSSSTWEVTSSSVTTAILNEANVNGMDDRSLSSMTPDMQSPTQKSINGSDILAVRYFGSGTGQAGDGTVINCVGSGVPAMQPTGDAVEGRGWNVFYVATDSSGEPELRCKYHGKTSWTSEAIARGVESFQVLYGLDTDSDGFPNEFITAGEIDELDSHLILTGPNAQARAIEAKKKTNWKKVAAIKVAILVCGSQRSRSDALTKKYELFGPEYTAEGSQDRGTAIIEEDIPPKQRNRLRRIFEQTIMLRNQTIEGNV